MSPFSAGLEVPTQVRHPIRATIRSAVQIAPMVGVSVGAIVEVVRDVRPDWVVAWGPAATAASLILTRVMALKPVNDLLTAVGLGAAPKPTPDLPPEVTPGSASKLN